MALPETVKGQPLEVWAIERFLSHYADRYVERTILNAIESGKDAVEVARSLSQGGMSSPVTPTVMWDRHGIRVHKDCGWRTPPSLVIPYDRVVEYVQGQLATQMTLF